MRISFKGALLLSTSLIVAAPAWSETDEDGFDLGDIRIEDEGAQTVLGNVNITTDDIEKRNPATIKDVFVGESSISTSGGAAIAQKVFVNGIEESLLNVTIDGARQNKSAFHHTGNVLIDPSLLKSVEVTSGLAPADAGPGGLAGSIAYTTKDAADLLTPGDDFGGRFSLTFGDNGYGTRSTLSLFGQKDGFDYLLSGTRHHGSEYADGDGATVIGTEAELSDYIAKMSFTTQTGHRFAFSASETEDTGLRAAQAGPGGLLFTRPDFAGLTSGPSVMIEGLARRRSYALTYTTQDAHGWYDPFVQLSYNEQNTDAGGVEGTNTSLSGTVKNTFRIAHGTVAAGVDFFDESAEGQTDAPLGYSGRETLQNIGIFAQARQDLSSRTSVSYGARYDFQDFEGADGTEFSDSGLSANAAVDFQLSDTLVLNAGLASTWGGYELGEAAVINFLTPWYYTDFRPSRSKSARLGLRYESGPWKASGAIFHTEVDDIAAVLPTSGDRGAGTDIQSRGFDGAVSYFWDEGFASLKYTYADVTADGDTIGSTAYYLGRPVGHIFAAEVAWEPAADWLIGGSAQFAPSFDKTNGVGGMTSLDSYVVVNAYAEYQPPQYDNLSIRLDIRNLFDETYVARGSDADGTSGQAIAINEAGRTFMLTASLTF